MKRYLGIDLGTKTVGIAITDKANILVVPYKLIEFSFEDYDNAKEEIAKIVKKEKITDIAVGLPKNMDGTLGFAAQRTMKFVSMLDFKDINIELVDERLSTVESKRILHDNNIKEKDFKDKIDVQSAVIILETYLRSIKNENK